jgi:hypothetical protein
VAAQHGAHARAQFLEFEGLEQVVVSACVQAADPVLQRIACGDDDDRRGHAACAHPAQHVQAIAPGQTQIEQHEVDRLGAQGVLGGTAVTHPVHRPAFLAQGRPQAVADHLIVFNQKQTHDNWSARLARSSCPQGRRCVDRAAVALSSRRQRGAIIPPREGGAPDWTWQRPGE